MIVAPIVAVMAFMEYYHIKIQNLKPSYPFGKWIIETGFEYSKMMLYIGVAAMAFAVLSYVSLLIKSLIRIVIILLIVAFGYILANKFK
jgi:hypothetical protein